MPEVARRVGADAGPVLAAQASAECLIQARITPDVGRRSGTQSVP